MKRRNFIKLGTAATSGTFLINALPVKAFSTLDLMASIQCSTLHDRALVIIQMRGGNDGLNTLIPIDSYATYADLRPTIRIPDSGANAYIELDSTVPVADQVGLHPNMDLIKNMYDQGKVHFIQGVGYPDHNRSHFKSTDLWLTGGDGTPDLFNLQDGWMGRYLEYCYESILGNPSPALPDPVGLQLGNKKPSLGFHTADEHAVSINLSGQDPAGFFRLISELGMEPPSVIPASDYGAKMQYIIDVDQNTNVYAKRISDVFNRGRNSSDANYPNSYLANQLKTVARLMNGGCKSKIFLVDIGGFDTHANQVQAGSSHLGEHANLLKQLSEAVDAFQRDLASMHYEDRVMTVTFSEFGRKAFENANYGTDHGTLAPMMIFGKHVNGGISGTNLDLNNLDNGAPTNRQWDYRDVFTDLLRNWLGASDDALIATGFLDYLNSGLDLVQTTQYADPTCAPLPDNPSEYSDPDDSHRFSIEIPTQGTTNPVDEPLVEITECDYVLLAPGFAAVEGSNIHIYPFDCDQNAASYLLPRKNQIATAQSITSENDDRMELRAQEDFMTQFDVYPNPMEDHVNIAFKMQAGEKNVKAAIARQDGAIMNVPLIHSFYDRGYYTLRFNTSQLPAGIYFAMLNTGQRKESVKIIKK